MKIIEKDQLKKFLSVFKRCFLAVAKHFFISCFILFVLALIISSLLYYYYGFLAERKEIETSSSPFELEESNYREVLKAWEERKDSFEKAEEKDYPDLFERFPEED